ncbi:MAG: dephospho-CoA kinase [Planctomycetaceae bacterium]|nr:dephospho-CoA kinase [Planctomycetaceae bacterium]
MKLLAITGGICSGKTTVSAMFAQLGAEVVDLDKVGHKALEVPDVITTLQKRWGEKVMTDANQISRRAVAEVVFADETELKFLESLIHPLIEKNVNERTLQAKRENKPAVLLDAPLLFEVGWDRMVDIVLFADCPEHIRLQRAKKRNWTEIEFQQRTSQQIPAEEKRKMSNIVFDTSQPKEAVASDVERFWKSEITPH